MAQKRKEFKPRFLVAKTPNQKLYIRNVLTNSVNFVLGPAGTGKTHVAIGLAVQLLKNEKIEKIVISRPLVGVGKDMGYLPGDIGDKVGPYVQPCFDELHYYLSYSEIKQFLQDGTVDVVPLSMMRGRTFNRCFVILDEAQNSTKTELKTFLTRIGFDSIMVIAGDPGQSDLENPDGAFVEAVNRLREVNGVSVSSLGYADIIRNSVVAAILGALW